jgi:glutamate/tyrosine decarboxylase-like PLP-dependent enzyme
MANQTRKEARKVAAWFLGPKAENAELEEKLLHFILQDYFHWRRNYYPSDEIIITETIRRGFTDWTDRLSEDIAEMLAGLRRHFPFYSPRYIAHMLSDQTIPSVLGYFAGMLYNPNNVTPEAAPVTVDWELEVGRDVLRMLGYIPPARRPKAGAFGWAHVTSGGTIANLEALWVARTVRYFPLAAREAALRHSIPVAVRLPRGGSAPLSKLSELECLSIRSEEALHLLPRFIHAVARRTKAQGQEAIRLAVKFLEETGVHIARQGAARCHSIAPPVLFVAGTRHYSIQKAANVLGIGDGADSVVVVDVDKAFRMDVRDLEHKLRLAVKRGSYPLAVVAIAGSTEEGAMDPVHEIVALRRKLEAGSGTSFWLHIDAAWGGYMRSIFIPAGKGRELPVAVNRFASASLDLHSGEYARTLRVRWGAKPVCRAFLAFPEAESITVDPHKMGYIPYPCGVVAFKSDLVRQFVSQESPYTSETTPLETLAHSTEPPLSVGEYILEGSKPGAAVAACWLSHRAIPLNRSGYGEIVRASLLAARELYEYLVRWEECCRANGFEAPYLFVPVTAQPPDTNIVCFLAKQRGVRSLGRTNALNHRIYRQFTIEEKEDEPEYAYVQPFFLSRTHFKFPAYSRGSVAELLKRAGLDGRDYEREGIFVLRATLMTPYIRLAEELGRSQRYLSQFMQKLRQRVDAALADENAAAPHRL